MLLHGLIKLRLYLELLSLILITLRLLPLGVVTLLIVLTAHRHCLLIRVGSRSLTSVLRLLWLTTLIHTVILRVTLSWVGSSWWLSRPIIRGEISLLCSHLLWMAWDWCLAMWLLLLTYLLIRVNRVLLLTTHWWSLHLLILNWYLAWYRTFLLRNLG